MPYDLYVEVKHDDAILIEEANNEEEEDEIKEFFEPTPVWVYRNPIYDGTQYEVDFDPREYNIVHVVLVLYSSIDDEGKTTPRWYIAKICTSRREAKRIAEEVEEGIYEADVPWLTENSIIDDVEIHSLGVED